MLRYLAQAVTLPLQSMQVQVEQRLQFYEKPFCEAQNNRVKKKKNNKMLEDITEKNIERRLDIFVESTLF